MPPVTAPERRLVRAETSAPRSRRATTVPASIPASAISSSTDVPPCSITGDPTSSDTGDYYICDGIYYRWWNDCYYVCRPPFGIFFDRALYNLDLVLCDFAYYSTVRRTYRIVNDNYRTIAEQNDIIAQNNATIAAQNAAIANGNLAADASYNLASRLGLFQSYANANQQYYYDDGIFFIEGANGQYQTIVPPAGALIAELPDDYEIITLDGVEYYKVDDTVYRTVVVDGKALFEVLGQLQN